MMQMTIIILVNIFQILANLKKKWNEIFISFYEGSDHEKLL